MTGKIALIYGTDTGNTEEVGRKISDALMDHGYQTSLFNIADTTAQTFMEYDFFIMGIPTWDFGGIQEDWEDVGDEIAATDFAGKVVALYGLGDQRGYGDYFVDAMGWLRNHLLNTGAQLIGNWSTEGYKFAASLAANDDLTEFCGLAIDEDQQFELTDQRIGQWVAQIIFEYETATQEA